MNPETGELMRLRKGDGLPEGFEPLPRELFLEAERKLRGQDTAQVNVRSQTPLAKWAKKKRIEKIAAKSRRRNRR